MTILDSIELIGNNKLIGNNRVTERQQYFGTPKLDF